MSGWSFPMKMRKHVCFSRWLPRPDRLVLLVLLAISSFAFAQAPSHDNRIKPGIKVGDPIPDYVPEVYPTEAALREKIVGFHDEKLSQAVGKYMALQWIRRVALVDADYILCFFDSSTRAEPGDNPRVLLLLTLDYQLKTWGFFTCEPGFASGHIVNPLHKPHTWFITVNASSRFGGELSFEKYLIASTGIRKLGWDYELRKIPSE